MLLQLQGQRGRRHETSQGRNPTMRLPRSPFAAIATAVVAFGGAAALQVATAPLAAASAPTYRLANVGPYGGEPTITANKHGELYDTTPSGGTLLYKSTDHGATWTKTTTADTSSGDDCVFTDQADSVYECNLAGSQSKGPLQADIWKSTNDGKTWKY